jgi:hypothetical protein
MFGRFINNYKKKVIEESDKQKAQELQKVRDAISSYILSDEGAGLFDAIARQKMILQRENRSTIAIFLSVDTLRFIMLQVFTKHEEEIDMMLDTLLALEVPVAHLGDLPVYVSPRLSRAPIFVIGDILWEIR